jgi:hypothetical protein
MASTPQPAASRKVLKRLQQASEQLQLLQCLQVRWPALPVVGLGPLILQLGLLPQTQQQPTTLTPNSGLLWRLMPTFD